MTSDYMLTGSAYFFSNYDDFKPHDIDKMQIVENLHHEVIHICKKGQCIFLVRKHDKTEEYFDFPNNKGVGMSIARFLVPEFCEQIGMTVEDLPKLSPTLAKLDKRHMYLKVIYDSYIENGAFYLTDEQRDKAYAEYKESRKMTIKKRGD